VTIGSCCADSTERRHRGATRNVALNEESRKPHRRCTTVVTIRRA